MMAGSNGYSEKELRGMVRKWVPRDRVPKLLRVKDTSDFFRVDYDDVVAPGGVPYLVRNNDREGRFGLEDEPKFWVRRAIDLLTGELKVLKWVFKEHFEAKIGSLVFDCVRSPQKEARILELVRGREDFVQGTTEQDSAGHPLRILDYIRGKTLSQIHDLRTKQRVAFHIRLNPAVDHRLEAAARTVDRHNLNIAGLQACRLHGFDGADRHVIIADRSA